MELIRDLGLLKPKPDSSRKRRYLLIKCHCSKEFKARADDYYKGKTRSCGCTRYESQTKHGLYSHKLYGVHSMIKQRCNNENHPKFKNWGGRGITYIEEWEDFKTFYDWCILNGYKEGLQIDRRDNNGNYTPDNCRFVTPKVNMSNRRVSKTSEKR